MEAILADDPNNDLVDVSIKMPARLRDHLASICERHDLKLDDVVCNQIKRWLLAKTIALIEAEAEAEEKSEGVPAGGETGKR
jgi:hypothetical protein